jgi:hypothetical protein
LRARSQTAVEVIDDMQQRVTVADIDQEWPAEVVWSNLERTG